jgi:hypothetical protein
MSESQIFHALDAPPKIPAASLSYYNPSIFAQQRLGTKLE